MWTLTLYRISQPFYPVQTPFVEVPVCTIVLTSMGLEFKTLPQEPIEEETQRRNRCSVSVDWIPLCRIPAISPKIMILIVADLICLNKYVEVVFDLSLIIFTQIRKV